MATSGKVIITCAVTGASRILKRGPWGSGVLGWRAFARPLDPLPQPLPGTREEG
jgi:hypothetical protein